MNPDEIKNKYLLLDTNILIDSSKHIDDFQEFYDFLIFHNVNSVLDNTVKFEFMRGIRTNDQLGIYEKFLKKLFGKDSFALHVDDSIFQTATKIAILYNRNNLANIKYGDCLITAQMYKYRDSSLFLATQDHNDFPRLIFDRVGVFTIDGKNSDQIFSIGIYKFNKSKYESLLKRFESI